jgi:hypothetical protein
VVSIRATTSAWVVLRSKSLSVGYYLPLSRFPIWNMPSRPRCFLAEDSVASLWPKSSLSLVTIMPPTDKPAPQDPQLDTSVSRREFTRRAAFCTAGLLAYPDLHRDAAHDAAAAPEPPQPSQPPQQTPASAPKLSPQGQAEAESRYQAIINQYGDRFSDAQKTDLKRLCIFAQPPLDRIRAYAVGNSDLPALYLKPLVDRDKKPPASGSLKPSSPAAEKSSATAKPTAPAKQPTMDKP